MTDSAAEIAELRAAVKAMMVYQAELVRQLRSSGALTKEQVAFAVSSGSSFAPQSGSLRDDWERSTGHALL